MASPNLSDLPAISGCVANLPFGLLQVLKVQILFQIANGRSMTSDDVQTLLAQSGCLTNCTSPGALGVLELQILFNMSNGGFGGVFSGHGNPNGVVTANAGSIYTDLDTMTQYTKSTNGGNTGWL